VLVNCPIAVDFHRGCLLLLTSDKLIGWNVHRGDWGEGTIVGGAHQTISKFDFCLNHAQSFDPRFAKLVKLAGRVLLIGTNLNQPVVHHIVNIGHIHHPRFPPAIVSSQRLVWISDGSLGAKNAEQGLAANWTIEKTEVGFTPDENKQVREVSMLALSPTKRMLANACGVSVQIWNVNNIGQGAHYLTVGSRTVSTNIVDPDYPEGVSRIVLTPGKVVVALGNVIRAYSFDLKV